MRLYRDVDYYLFFLDFPHPGAYGTATANTDGTVNIYINTLLSPETQLRTVKHELRHMAKGHLWDDVKPITEKELEADDPRDCAFGRDFAYVEYTPEPPFADLFADPANPPHFPSLEAFHRYILRLRDYCAENDIPFTWPA